MFFKLKEFGGISYSSSGNETGVIPQKVMQCTCGQNYFIHVFRILLEPSLIYAKFLHEHTEAVF
jgi:hypothetical protein